MASARRLATRARLLEAAAEVFAEEGLQGAAVEAICSRAGFTRGAFYSNFEHKEQLLLALLESEFTRRIEHLEAQVEALSPELSASGFKLDASEVARYVVDFFAPEHHAASWLTLESEFLLLALRDPSIAPEYRSISTRYFAGMAQAVDRVVGITGRRFTIPIEQAVQLLGSSYDLELRDLLISGRDIDDLDALGARIASLLFAITEPRAE